MRSVERQERRAHAISSSSSRSASASSAADTAASFSGGQAVQPRREPGRAPRANRAQDAVALVGHPERLAATVERIGRPPYEAGLLDPRDGDRHRRRRDPLARGELADADPRRLADQAEQGGLAAGDSERRRLAAQLTVQLEQNRPELTCDLGRRDVGCCILRHR